MLVVPTHTQPPTLARLIERAGMPAVVVHTAPGSRDLPGVLNVRDEGETNIHRWWNAGLDAAMAAGARFVVVANHDAEVPDVDQLPALLRHLESSGATLAFPGRVASGAETDWPSARKLTGWCWAVDTSHGLRAPEQFRWWYGDDWLDREARLRHHGVAVAAVRAYHRKVDGAYPPSFAAIVAADRRRWAEVLHPMEGQIMADARSGIVVAKENTMVPGNGRVPVVIRKGEAWAVDSPVVRAHPDLFSSDPGDARGLEVARPVERATRAPGEQSNARRAG